MTLYPPSIAIVPILEKYPPGVGLAFIYLIKNQIFYPDQSAYINPLNL